MHTLLLNADFSPHDVIPSVDALWKYAFAEKARHVADYADRVIRSYHATFACPAVVALLEQAPAPHRRERLKCTRWAVIARDRATCQYCGTPGAPRSLTQDHVVPWSRRDGRNQVVLPWSGKRVHVEAWENKLCACERCNNIKDNRTPDEAGMPMLSTPRRPRGADALRILLRADRIPPEWNDYLLV